MLLAVIPDYGNFSVRIGVEMVDGNNYRNAELLQILDMNAEVHDSLFKGFNVLPGEVGLCNAAVVLQCADSCYQHGAVRFQAGIAALDVKELLRSEVGAEARLGNGVVAELHCKLGRSHGVAAVSDVRERTAVDKRGIPLKRLHEVRVDGVPEQRGHCAHSVEVACEYRLAGIGVGNQNIAKALL